MGLLLATAVACAPSGGAHQRAPVVTALEAPADSGAAQPFVAALPDGRVALSWQAPTAGGHAVRVALLAADGRWSPPATVVERDDLFVNWADFPGLTPLASGGLAVYWLQRNGPGTYAYDVRVARSTDDGRRWTAGALPYAASIPAEHGFVSLWDVRGDSVGLVWLDGRGHAAAEAAEAGGEHGAGESMLVHARVAADGGASPEAVLDRRTCDCCQTAHVRTPRGSVVAYRDRSPDEIRDVAVVREVDGRWSEPVVPHADGWRIAGCPVNGPQLAARGDTVALAWFTAAGEAPRVQLALSYDAGVTWSAPVRIDDGAAIGRVDVEATDAGAVVAWLERAGTHGAEVRVRAVSWTGERGRATPLGTTTGARASGFPRLAPIGSGVVAAWTDVAAGRLRLARVAW